MKNKITILGMIAIPVGAILLTACGPVNNENELALDEASDTWSRWTPNWLSEYGHCLDGWDNDGNGLKDAEDPDCHLSVGPLRDLSMFSFPEGHNFFPDISKTLPGGPGFAGGFRDPEQITRWLRFLTGLDGNVAAYDIFAPSVNPLLVPIPEPLPAKVRQGTAAAGNNNNLDIVGLHDFYLYHDFLAGRDGAGAVAEVAAEPVAEAATTLGQPRAAAETKEDSKEKAAEYAKKAATRLMPKYNRNKMNKTNSLPKSFSPMGNKAKQTNEQGTASSNAWSGWPQTQIRR